MRNNANEIILDTDRKPNIEHYNSFIEVVLGVLLFASYFVVAWLVQIQAN
jgi:hypothetical protein